MPPGIFNSVDNEDLDKIMPDIIKKFRNLIKQISQQEKNVSPDKDIIIGQMIFDYATILSSELRKHTEDLQRAVNTPEENQKWGEQLISFVSSSNLFNIYNYTYLNPPLEKDFMIEKSDTSPEDNIYNWKVNIFFQDGTTEDLLETCFRTRSLKIKDEGVKLSYLLDCVRNRGIKNLIILDLSCNSFDHEEIYLKDNTGEFIPDSNNNLQENSRSVRRVKRKLMKYRKQTTRPILPNKLRRSISTITRSSNTNNSGRGRRCKNKHTKKGYFVKNH